MFQVAAWVFAVPDEVFARRVALLLGGSPNTRETTYVVLEDAYRFQTFVEQLKEDGADVLSAPKLVTLPVQRGSLSAGETISYVKDYDVRRVGEAIIADPVIDTLQAGISLTTLVADLPDGRIGLSVGADIYKLLDMPKYDVDLAEAVGADFPGLKSTKVWIQLPSGESTQVDLDVRIPDGATIMLALPNKIDGKWQVLAVSVSSVEWLQRQRIQRPSGSERRSR